MVIGWVPRYSWPSSRRYRQFVSHTALLPSEAVPVVWIRRNNRPLFPPVIGEFEGTWLTGIEWRSAGTANLEPGTHIRTIRGRLVRRCSCVLLYTRRTADSAQSHRYGWD